MPPGSLVIHTRATQRGASNEPTPGFWFEWEVEYLRVSRVDFALPGPLIGRLTLHMLGGLRAALRTGFGAGQVFGGGPGASR